jgi:hypothetical protein
MTYPKSIVQIVPQTTYAHDWLKENVQAENWQWTGPSLAIDVRYLDDIVQGMKEEGIDNEFKFV